MEEVIISNIYTGHINEDLGDFYRKLNGCTTLSKMKSFLGTIRDIVYHWHMIDEENQQRGLLIVSVKKSAEPNNLNKSLCGTIFNFDFSHKFPFSFAIVPPRIAFDRTDFNKVLRSKGAKLYRLHDGSSVNLHHNEDLGWVVSTTNGCYMNEVSWANITFMELVTECLASRKLTLENLDARYTYSFICMHPSMHPLATEPSMIVVASSDPKIPTDDAEIPITDFQSLSVECEQALTAAASGCVPNYGYIVRNENTTAAIQSSLMKFIFDYHHNVPQTLLKDPRRKKWLDLRGYMSFHREAYLKLFNAQQQFDEFDATFASLVQKIITHHHMAVKNSVDPIVVKLYEDARKLITIDSPVGVKLLKDVIINPNYLPFYLANGLLGEPTVPCADGTSSV